MPYDAAQWITVDVGGTLLSPNPSVGEVYAEIIANHGIEADPKALEASFFSVWRQDVSRTATNLTPEGERRRWRRVIDKTFADYRNRLDGDALFADLWQAFTEPARWRISDGAVETLEGLRRRSYRLAILSNWDERLRPLLAAMNLDRLFDELFISVEVGYEKPDRRIFEAVEEKAGATGDQIVHIGDSIRHDVEGAEALGWSPILIFPHKPAPTDLVSIDSFPELLHVL